MTEPTVAAFGVLRNCYRQCMLTQNFLERLVSQAAAIRQLLAEIGPLTSREVAEHLGAKHRDVAGALCSMRKAVTQTAYVHSWTLDGTGRTYPRPLWMVGQRKDAPKPAPLSESFRCKRYKDARRRRVSSVFQLGGRA